MPESLSPSRLEAFSDGVMAVIITIMVLELKVPSGHDMSDGAALLDNARIGLLYLLSFVQVGIYWVNHHYLLEDLKSVTHGILWANLVNLFCLSFLPFGLEWVGTRGIRPVPVAVYACCFFLPAVSCSLLSWTIRRRTHIPPAAGLVKQAVSSLTTLAAIWVAFRAPSVALCMIGAVAVLWLFPPRRILEKTRELDPTHSPASGSA